MKKTISNRQLETAHKQCLERERIREPSVGQYRQLISLCDRYAKTWFVRHNMPMCDLEPTTADAADNACERIAGKRDIRNLRSFMRVSAYRAVIDAIRKRKTRANDIWIDAISLTRADRDETNEDDEIVEEGFFCSDGGEGAKTIRRTAENARDAKREPKWLKLYRQAMRRQKGDARKVLRALRKDSRRAVAAEIAGLSRYGFYTNLKKIQEDFSQCFQAYRAFVRRNRSDTFWFSYDYTLVGDV